MISAAKVTIRIELLLSLAKENFREMAEPLAEKIILGIDPGTNVMGYGVIKVQDKKASIITMGVIDICLPSSVSQVSGQPL